jgi:hypothetical protein
MISRGKNKKGGAAMLITLFLFLGVSLTLAYAATIGVTTELRTYRTLASSKASYIAADAGVEDAFYRVLNEMTVSPSYSIGLMPAAATATVAYNVADDSYDISVSAQSGEQVRRMLAHVSRNVSLPMRYAVASGVGGIDMSNGTLITSTDGSGGDIYSIGTVNGAGSGSSIIRGDVTVGAGLDPYTASSSLCSTDAQLLQNASGRWMEVAQQFNYSAVNDDIIGKVDLMLKKSGSPTDLSISIYDDNAGKPGTQLAVQTIPSSLALTSAYQWIPVAFQNPPWLTVGENYWIVARYQSTSNSATNKWFVCYGPDSYPSWQSVARSGINSSGSPGAYSNLSGDLSFRTYLGGGNSKISNVRVQGITKADSISGVYIDQDAYYLSPATLTGGTVVGTKYPGSPTPPRPSLPLTNETISDWQQDAADGGEIAGGLWGSRSVGPRVATSTVTTVNDAIITVTGTLHVLGDLNLGNNSIIKCAAAFLDSSCLVIVDGSINPGNNADFQGSGTTGSFITMLSLLDGCLPSAPTPPSNCSVGPSAISIKNNVSGAIFYAVKSSVYIYNNAQATSVYGYHLNLSNNTQVLYDPLAQYMRFSPSVAETVGKYRVNSWNEI